MVLKQAPAAVPKSASLPATHAGTFSRQSYEALIVVVSDDVQLLTLASQLARLKVAVKDAEMVEQADTLAARSLLTV